MIITRAPFRVSFSGGSTDIPSFYEKYGGCVLSAAIKKYMYLEIHDYFYEDQILLKYSKTETVNKTDDIEHPIFRQCLSDFGIKGAEINSMADIPSGTGLGSSSSFTVALLHLLHTYRNEFISKQDLAEEACSVEIRKLGNPIGKQDQYAAAFGGLNFFRFMPDGNVTVEPVIMTNESYKKLQSNILMFFIGGTHSASEILKKLSEKETESKRIPIQKEMCSLTVTLKDELQKNNVDALGGILNENWCLKKKLHSEIANSHINDIYEKAVKAGACGGKLLGAGGAGFMIFYVPEDKHENVRKELSFLREMKFEIDYCGSTVIHYER